MMKRFVVLLCLIFFKSLDPAPAVGQHDFSDSPVIIVASNIAAGAGGLIIDKNAIVIGEDTGEGLTSAAPIITEAMQDASENTISADGDLYASQMQLSSEAICWYFNTDGSCVQCSIGMTGVHAKDLNAACVLFKSPYGKAERGGSYPSRVADYFARRGIKGWNVTGWPATRDWAIWAHQTGRFAAIGFFRSHFQTLYAFDPNHKDANGKLKPWGIMNNWAKTNAKIDWYTEEDFKSLHLASGPWIVILERPCSDNPEIVQWW
jgi:hypothetical protein